MYVVAEVRQNITNKNTFYVWEFFNIQMKLANGVATQEKPSKNARKLAAGLNGELPCRGNKLLSTMRGSTLQRIYVRQLMIATQLRQGTLRRVLEFFN